MRESAERAVDGKIRTRTLQRLIDSQKFRKNTAVSLAKRGKTLTEIDRLLDEYHKLLKAGALLKRDKGMRRMYQILVELEQDTAFWIESHESDTTDRAKQRRPGIFALHQEVLSELTDMRRVQRRAQEAGRAFDTFVPQENKFLATMRGSASSILEALGTAIGLAIPNPGDSVEAGLSVEIPTDPNAVSFVGFRLNASASRSDGRATKVRLEAALKAGGKVAGLADLTGEFGFFLEAHGASPEHAMRLISYGWYRQFREARGIPREVANFMWGGSTTSVGWKRSEQWAANVEKESFKRVRTPGRTPAGEEIPADVNLSSGVGSAATTNEYVRMGALTGISADVGGIASSIVDVSGSASASFGVHYDQTSIEQAKRGAANVGTPMKERARFNLKHLGSGFLVLDTALSATVGPFSGQMGMALELLTRKHRENDQDKAWPEGYLSAGGSLSLAVPLPKYVGQAISNGLKSLAARLAQGNKRIEVKAKREKGPAAELAADSLASAGDTLNATLGMVPSGAAIEAALATSDGWMTLVAGSAPLPGSLTLAINGGYQFGAGSKGWTFDVSLSHGIGGEINASLVGLTLAKSSRLMRIVLTSDGWNLVVD